MTSILVCRTREISEFICGLRIPFRIISDFLPMGGLSDTTKLLAGQNPMSIF
jgi:hypothetical protein